MRVAHAQGEKRKNASGLQYKSADFIKTRSGQTQSIHRSTDGFVEKRRAGGRLDATNIVRRPTATAVTRLDYDHVQVLGDTLTLIAGACSKRFLPSAIFS